MGIQLDCPAGDVVTSAREQGLVVITAGGGDVVRLVPPLIVSEVEIDRAVEVLVSELGKLAEE